MLGMCSQAWGQLRNVLFCSRFNTVDIHKINLLSEEINPMLCSHGNTSHAAQFQSWDFMGSHPSWSSCFPGRSIRAQEWGSGQGGGGGSSN